MNRIYLVEYDDLAFKIEEDKPDVGAYLYVYKDGTCIKDYLQNDVKNCMELALEIYNIPMTMWKQSEK